MITKFVFPLHFIIRFFIFYIKFNHELIYYLHFELIYYLRFINLYYVALICEFKTYFFVQFFHLILIFLNLYFKFHLD